MKEITKMYLNLDTSLTDCKEAKRVNSHHPAECKWGKSNI